MTGWQDGRMAGWQDEHDALPILLILFILSNTTYAISGLVQFASTIESAVRLNSIVNGVTPPTKTTKTMEPCHPPK